MKKSIYIIGAILLSFLFVIEVDAKVISDNNLLLTGIFNGVYHLGEMNFQFPFVAVIVVLGGIFILPFSLIVLLLVLFIRGRIKYRNKKKGISISTRGEKILKICNIVMFVPLIFYVISFAVFYFGIIMGLADFDIFNLISIAIVIIGTIGTVVALIIYSVKNEKHKN